MTEFSDYTNLLITLTVLFIFYVYLRFIRIKIMSSLSWSDVKCNPFYLFVGGMFDSNEAQNIFNQCVKNSAKEELYEKYNDNMKENNKKVDNYIKGMNTSVSNNDEQVKKRHSALITLLNESNSDVKDVINRQNQINEIIVKSSTPMKDLSSKMKDLTTSFKDTMRKFLDSNLVSDLGNQVPAPQT